MPDILALLQCMRPPLAGTTIRQFSRILLAMLVMTGRVTMLGISRWAGQGGSYRTVQRFFCSVIPWAQVFWQFFRQHLLCPTQVYILAGDECVVTKSGKQTFGLDRFFSSLYGKPVKAVSFFVLSLVSTQERHAFPIQVQQVVRSEAEKAASQAKREAAKTKAPAVKRKAGRPKGSQNKNKTEVSLNPELVRIQTMIQTQQRLMDGLIPLSYLVLDGHFGNHPALHMTRQCHLHLISKLRCDAALYVPYVGPYCGHGPRRKYGQKLDYRHIPEQYLQQTTIEGQIKTRIYQAQLLHKEFAQPLNVVIIVKTNLQTQAWAHVILFSSDLTLAYDRLIDYYGLRFQIEFNFRDAKQYWGLEDFMNVSQTAVTNAANLSLFMVDFTSCLLRDLHKIEPDASVLDLKAHYRGYKYVDATLKMLPQMPEPILVAHIFSQVAGLGRIHTFSSHFSPS